MAGNAEILDILFIGCFSHGRQRIPSVAKVRMGMDGAAPGCLFHCIRSCLTLWSTTWRFSSSAVMSCTEMPICTISTITW